jgi:hypothetical protein
MSRAGSSEEAPQTVPHVLVIVAADDAASVAGQVRTLKERVHVVYEERGEVLVDGPNDVAGSTSGSATASRRSRRAAGFPRKPRHFLSRRYIDPEDARALDFREARTTARLARAVPVRVSEPTRRGAGRATPARRSTAGTRGWPTDRSSCSAAFGRTFPSSKRFLAEESARVAGLDPDRLAAMLVGRWPNGTALAVDPEQPEEAPMSDRLRVNHFVYGNDAAPIRVCADPFVATEEAIAERDELRQVPGAPADLSGDRCPTFAHVRKVNPRDRVTDQGGPAITLRSQMLRRGITFGPRYKTPDDNERGLLFLRTRHRSSSSSNSSAGSG